jgi:PEP-CTERM motif
MPYGINDHTTPAIHLLASGLASGANSVTLTYQGGLASTGIYWPPAGPEDYPNHPWGPYVGPFGCGPGSTGGFGSQGIMPCHYIDPNNVGPSIWEGALIAAFTDNSGVVVGHPFAPFATGEAPYSIGIPTGATELSFGYNDHIHGDDTGGWDIGVAYSALPSTVPEPETWTLCAIGFATLGAIWSRRARPRLGAASARPG